MKIKSFECPKSIRNYEKNTWNVRRLVAESFVPSAQWTSKLYCRLSNFCKLRKSVLEASAGYLSEFQCKSQNEDWNVQKVWKISRTQVSFEVWSSWLLSHQTTNSSKNIGLYPEWFLIGFLYFCYCLDCYLGLYFPECFFHFIWFSYFYHKKIQYVYISLYFWYELCSKLRAGKVML